MGKATTNSQIINAFTAARQAGIETLAFVLFCYPGESLTNIAQTLRLLNQIRPTYVHPSICRRFPGTKLEQQMKTRGRFPDDDWLIRPALRKSDGSPFRAYGFPALHFYAAVGLLAVKCFGWLRHLRAYSLHDSPAVELPATTGRQSPK